LIQTFNDLNLKLYSKVLSNGLCVYVVPMSNKHDIYVTFTTKYGSNIVEFDYNGSIVKVPYGVAHFLEHKMFEDEKGEDPFKIFSLNGANSNAFTTYDHTTYLFSGPNKFYENLNCLLDFVQSPYFTDENVEKEKGIIDQERIMYQDDPDTRMHDRSMYNLLVEHPLKYPIIGTHDSIYSITKEDLYKCYNTFYHPNNMFVVVTGNVNPDEVFRVVEENQGKKSFDLNNNFKIKKYNEPNIVVSNFEKIKMDVTIPKVSLSYKIKINKDVDLYDFLSYLTCYFDMKLGVTSVTIEEMKNKKIIYYDIEMDLVVVDDYVLVRFSADTNEYKKFIDIVDNVLNDKKLDELEFIRKKKCYISSLILSSDSIFSVNRKIMNNIIRYGDVIVDEVDRLECLSFDLLDSIVKTVSFNNKCVILVNNE